MFIRKKKNKSGVVSVQIINKISRKYKVVKTIGSSSDNSEVDRLVLQGQQWIKVQKVQLDLDFGNEQKQAERFFSSIKQLYLSGTELLLGKLFDEIGFNQIKDKWFRWLVIHRLCFPLSKLKTTEYLYRYHQIQVDEDRIYRYLDRLYTAHKALVQQISYRHTLKVLDNKIAIVFYDVTTLYFEIDQEDDLRKTGFSKDGKHQHPQIVLGLLVSLDGYPLAYEIFEGNQFEGHTMLPVIRAFEKKYGLGQLVIVADAGLLSNANIEQLEADNYQYILGARIKNESPDIKERILALKLANGQSKMISRGKNTHLIISYSAARAKKDEGNRQKGINKLNKMIQAGRLTKSSLNKRGYNKFLKLDGKITVTLNQDKISQDVLWDGLKGYLTNTRLTNEQIINNYNELWKIEKAFRVAKSDLKIRPIYHRLPRRIEAHICIAFAAYKVYKELERQLKLKGSYLSPQKAIEIAKTIFTLKIISPLNGEPLNHTLLLTEEQKYLAKLYGF